MTLFNITRLFNIFYKGEVCYNIRSYLSNKIRSVMFRLSILRHLLIRDVANNNNNVARPMWYICCESLFYVLLLSNTTVKRLNSYSFIFSVSIRS